MGYSKRRVYYGSDRYVIIETLTDEIRFARLMELYKKYESIEALDDALIQIY